MFIAMNRFQVIRGQEEAFEQVWLSRDIHLGGVPGFIEFHLLRGPSQDDHTLFSSHTVWRSREDFEMWTRSEAFRQAHRNAGDNKPLYLGHPRFEGFEIIQTVKRDAASAAASN
jgi:heme-degrading monooxygenase HmoA